MIKQLLLAAAFASTTTIVHITGHMATSGTNGAWVTQRIEVPDGTTVIHVSASADGKNTPIDCAWTDPYGQAAHVEKNTLMCSAKVKDLVLPSHVKLMISNDYKGPADYDISVENTK